MAKKDKKELDFIDFINYLMKKDNDKSNRVIKIEDFSHLKLDLSSSNILAELREEFGLSQKDFAELIGVDVSVWNRIESGKRKLNCEILEKLYEEGAEIGKIIKEAGELKDFDIYFNLYYKTPYQKYSLIPHNEYGYEPTEYILHHKSEIIKGGIADSYFLWDGDSIGEIKKNDLLYVRTTKSFEGDGLYILSELIPFVAKINKIDDKYLIEYPDNTRKIYDEISDVIIVGKPVWFVREIKKGLTDDDD